MISFLLALAVTAQTSDSVRQARYERVLNNATDALDRVRGATAGFRTDLPTASASLVLQRAERVRGTCRDAGAAVGAVDSLMAQGLYVGHAQHQQSELMSGGAELRRVLTQCERQWRTPTPPTYAAADSLRAWGPYRTAQLDAALRRYLAVVRGFMKKASLKKPAVS